MEFVVNNEKKEKLRDWINKNHKFAKAEPICGIIFLIGCFIVALCMLGFSLYCYTKQPQISIAYMRWIVLTPVITILSLFFLYAFSRAWNVYYENGHNPYRANEKLCFNENTLFYSYTMFNPKDENSKVFIVIKLRDIQYVYYDDQTENIRFFGDFFGHFYTRESNKVPNYAGKLNEFEIRDWFNRSLKETLEKNGVRILAMEK